MSDHRLIRFDVKNIISESYYYACRCDEIYECFKSVKCYDMSGRQCGKNQSFDKIDDQRLYYVLDECYSVNNKTGRRNYVMYLLYDLVLMKPLYYIISYRFNKKCIIRI